MPNNRPSFRQLSSDDLLYPFYPPGLLTPSHRAIQPRLIPESHSTDLGVRALLAPYLDTSSQTPTERSTYSAVLLTEEPYTADESELDEPEYIPTKVMPKISWGMGGLVSGLRRRLPRRRGERENLVSSITDDASIGSQACGPNVNTFCDSSILASQGTYSASDDKGSELKSQYNHSRAHTEDSLVYDLPNASNVAKPATPYAHSVMWQDIALPAICHPTSESLPNSASWIDLSDSLPVHDSRHEALECNIWTDCPRASDLITTVPNDDYIQTSVTCEQSVSRDDKKELSSAALVDKIFCKKSSNSLVRSRDTLSVTEQLRALGWSEYMLPDGSSYYHNILVRATTNIDLRNAIGLQRVSDAVEDALFSCSATSMVSSPPNTEIFLEEVATHDGVSIQRRWVNHRRCIAADISTRTHPTVSTANEGAEAECHYWSFIDAHPAHVSLSPKTRQSALEALEWAYSARFLPTTRAATDTSQFVPEECRELMNVIRSRHTSPVVKKRLIARVMLRVAERRMGHIKTETASRQPSPETGDRGHLRDIYSPVDKISRWYIVYSCVLLTVILVSACNSLLIFRNP